MTASRLGQGLLNEVPGSDEISISHLGGFVRRAHALFPPSWAKGCLDTVLTLSFSCPDGSDTWPRGSCRS